MILSSRNGDNASPDSIAIDENILRLSKDSLPQNSLSLCGNLGPDSTRADEKCVLGQFGVFDVSGAKVNVTFDVCHAQTRNSKIVFVGTLPHPSFQSSTQML
jgi:hypothetical protein